MYAHIPELLLACVAVSLISIVITHRVLGAMLVADINEDPS